MIRWRIYLRHVSGHGYDMLCESSVIHLPTQRTLRDYTYFTKTAAGFYDGVDQQLMEAGNIKSCNEREKFVVL